MPFVIKLSIFAYVATAFLWLVMLLYLMLTDKDNDSARASMNPLLTVLAVLILYDIASVIPVGIYFVFLR